MIKKIRSSLCLKHIIKLDIIEIGSCNNYG